MVTSTQPAVPRVLNTWLWVLQALLAAFFVFAAAPKLLGDQAAVQMFDLIGFGQWFRYFTGSVELLGAIGLLIPRLCGLAAAGLACVMIGATLTQIFAFGTPAMAIMPILLFAAFVAVARARRNAPSTTSADT